MNERSGRRPPRGSGRHSGSPPPRRRREPLQDHYYYEEPPRGQPPRGQPPRGQPSRGQPSRGWAPEDFEDISSYSSQTRRRADQMAARRPRRNSEPQRPRRGKRPGGGRRAFKTLLLLFAVLVLAGGLYVFWYMLSGLTMTTLTGDKDALGIGDVQSDSKITNIALFGLDARDDNFEGRSDALMVLTVDQRHHKLKLTSILRDSQVYIDGYGYDKITHAYAYGGPELSIRTLNQNYHLDIQDYVTVNFVEMAKIVDAFGGVEMELSAEEKVQVNQNLWDLRVETEGQADAPEIWNTDFFQNIYGTPDWANGEPFEGGPCRLNGNQAVAFARIRHLEGGDDVRAGRQQLVLQGLVHALKGKSKLSYPALVHDVVPMCETSLDYMGMMSLAPFALRDFSMESLTIPGPEENAYGDYNENGAWVYMYDIEAAAAHIRRFIFEE